MKSEIQQLKLEIGDYQAEVAKLRSELSAKSAVAPQPTSGSPSEISTALRVAAVTAADRAADIQGLKYAISTLEEQLNRKREQFKELEQEEKRQMQLQRIAEGRDKIRAKSKDIEKASESLRLLFFEMKKLSDEYESDFGEIYPAGSGEKILNIAHLLNFSPLSIPQLTEEKGRFIFGCVPFYWTK